MTLPKDWDKMSIHNLYHEFGKQRLSGRESPTPDAANEAPAHEDISLINPSADWSDDIPPLEWTVQDLIPKRQVCLFSGHGAAGKSTIALHLAAAHALGENFLSFTPEPGPALFFDAEDEVLVMRHRLAAILRNYGKNLSDLNGQLAIISRAGRNAILATNTRSGVILPTPLYLELEQIVKEIKPRQIVIASSANVFSGNELDRTQVTQFISMLTRLAIDADGSVVLISHPSLTGMSTGSGISGSTSWHNAVRAQIYLEGLKDEGEEEAQGLRQLVFKKNQYGPAANKITLKWQEGMFLPPPSEADYERAARADACIHLIIQALNAGRILSPNPKANNYLPTVLASEYHSKKDLRTVMEYLLQRSDAEGNLRIEEYGSPSRRAKKLVTNLKPTQNYHMP